MKKVFFGACLLVCGLFPTEDANADTVYTYTVSVQEAYAYEVRVEEILDYLEIVHSESTANKGALSKLGSTVQDGTCRECHSDAFMDEIKDQIIAIGPRTPRWRPRRIPVITPPRPVIGPFIPVIDTSTPAPVTPRRRQ